ncbi:MAG: hypothetical protein M5R36_21025 [Deltaproteobacteria bacterium]|nr:hypothetical protein [Deltaproteobacteria bacterium]
MRWVDTALDVEMDDKITAAFDLAGQGSIPIINAQIAALTVTRVFWEYLNLHTDWPAGHDRFVEAFAAFDEWLERADAWVGDGGIFAKTREAALAEGSAASALALAREVALVNLLAELDLMEQRLEDRPEAALVHEARGLQFLHILYQDISRKNREDAVYVMGEFRDHPKDVDTAEIRTRLKKLFGAEVRTIGESTFDRRGVALNDVFAP